MSSMSCRLSFVVFGPCVVDQFIVVIFVDIDPYIFRSPPYILFFFVEHDNQSPTRTVAASFPPAPPKGAVAIYRLYQGTSN